MKRVERDIPKDRLLLNIRNMDLRGFAFLHQRKKIRDLILFLIPEEVTDPFEACHRFRVHL
jgi:hypothetical protein